MARIAQDFKKLANYAVKRFWHRGQDPFSRWFSVRGDDTLRLKLPLDSSSVVLDLGGYRGQWASDVFAKYQCTIHVFEPVGPFADFIKDRFSRNDQIKTHAFGLGATDAKLQMHINDNSSSTVAQQAEGITTEVEIRDIVKTLDSLGVSKVDAIKINIEGGEFDLLDRMLDAGIVHHFGHLQIQFHNFFPTAPARRNAIRERLAKTHSCDYCFEFVWEGWTLKS